MGVSFTISKKGKRYRPQPKTTLVEEQDTNEHNQDFYSDGAHSSQAQNQKQNQGNPTMHTSSAKAKSLALFKSTLEQLEALGPSFSLNLFEDGFTFGDTEEIFHDVPENLIPYCHDTDLILTDIQCGRIPTGVLQDMPLKYVNGTILCEVRDYRVFIEFPIVDTIPLKMSLDNVIEDMESMSEQFSYSDMLKFQSKVLVYLYPHLNLDPTPTFEFGSDETIPKIDLGIGGGRKRKRTGVMPDVGSLLDRFDNINTLTRRHVVAQRKPVEGPSFITSGYSMNLISTRLDEVEMNDL
ncbi:hypothetical protein M8C21_032116 [Ambrosia artemisiifolia]|uniref:Spt20-like SEP domain-containing protein n=1 Tax=Ambrosia artemisiifolia TaxID=4212 RepID=A0AAD5GAI0_AMBAR|nr:hypothetical protein M8C21_032116 [Ambrosia artemisiifolia]